MRPSDERIGVDQQARRPAASAGSRRCSHSASRAMSATSTCRCRKIAAPHEPFLGPTGTCLQRVEVGCGNPPAGDTSQHIRCGVVQADGAQRIGSDPLRGLGDRLQRFRKVRVAGYPLEHAPLAGGEELAALALGDVGDAAANQPSSRGRQANQPDLAGDVVTERVAMQPFEAGRLARECAVEVAAGDAGRRASRLPGFRR